MGMRSKGEARSAQRNVLEAAVCTGIECTSMMSSCRSSILGRRDQLAWPIAKGHWSPRWGYYRTQIGGSILAGKELMFRDDCP